MGGEEEVVVDIDSIEQLKTILLKAIKENYQNNAQLMKFEMEMGDEESASLLEALIGAIIELEPEKMEIYIHVPKNKLTENREFSVMYF